MKRMIKVFICACMFLGCNLISVKANSGIQPYSSTTIYLSKTNKVYTTINNVSNTYYVEILLRVKVDYNMASGEILSVSRPTANITTFNLPNGYKLGSLQYDSIRSAIINSDNTVTAIAGVRIPVLTSSGSSTNYAFPGGTGYHYINFINQSVS